MPRESVEHFRQFVNNRYFIQLYKSIVAIFVIWYLLHTTANISKRRIPSLSFPDASTGLQNLPEKRMTSFNVSRIKTRKELFALNSGATDFLRDITVISILLQHRRHLTHPQSSPQKLYGTLRLCTHTRLYLLLSIPQKSAVFLSIADGMPREFETTPI